jgi:hypothetical protein
MLGSLFVYVGLLTSLLGTISLVRPLRFLGVASRGRAAWLLAAGTLVIILATAWPAPETRVAAEQSQLDHFVPVYQFHEFHSIRVAAPKERVYRAIKEVTANEILLFRTLTWIRRFGRPGPESILNAPEQMPLLEVATRTSFLQLAEEPGREIVLGTLVATPALWLPKADPTPEDFRGLHASGFALAAMNFQVEDEGPGTCLVKTETRVYATDAATSRRFARYWRLIYPGSALIRRIWLRAVRRRAEAAPT